MNKINSRIGMKGNLQARVIRAPGAPLKWKIRQWTNVNFLKGFLQWKLAYFISTYLGIPTITSTLEARLIKADGKIVYYGIVGYRVVTTAGVGFLVDDWDNSAVDITDMNYHASGSGQTAEAIGDTALVTEETTITNRATGTKSQPAANQIRSIGTQSFTGGGTIWEHGLFSVVTESAGVLWDRTKLAASIGVGVGDAIEWTYTCTISAGS